MEIGLKKKKKKNEKISKNKKREDGRKEKKKRKEGEKRKDEGKGGEGRGGEGTGGETGTAEEREQKAIAGELGMPLDPPGRAEDGGGGTGGQWVRGCFLPESGGRGRDAETPAAPSTGIAAHRGTPRPGRAIPTAGGRWQHGGGRKVPGWLFGKKPRFFVRKGKKSPYALRAFAAFC